jgi:hypothetical protein
MDSLLHSNIFHLPLEADIFESDESKNRVFLSSSHFVQQVDVYHLYLRAQTT